MRRCWISRNRLLPQFLLFRIGHYHRRIPTKPPIHCQRKNGGNQRSTLLLHNRVESRSRRVHHQEGEGTVLRDRGALGKQPRTEECGSALHFRHAADSEQLVEQSWFDSG